MLDKLKIELGERCTFLSYLRDKKKNENGEFKERLCLKVVLKNKLGGKDSLVLPLNDGATYDSVLHILKNYERSADTI